MAILTGQGAAIELVIYKDGDEITIDNYPILFNSISHVRAEVKGGETSRISITLTPSYADAIDILSSGIIGTSAGARGQVPASDTLTPSPTSIDTIAAATDPNTPATAKSNMTYYAVRFFYIGGDTTPWYGGFACVPSFTLGTDIEITINVTGIHNLMSIGGGPYHFTNQPALDVIQKLADAYNIDITFDEDDDETEQLLTDTLISGSYNEDYDGVIRRILSDLRCVYVKYDGDEANPQPQYKVKSTQYLNQQPVEYHFVKYHQIAPEDGVVPIEELSLESAGALLAPGHAFGTYSRAVLSATKQVKTEVSSPTGFKRQATSGIQTEGGAFPLDSGDGAAKGGATGLTDTGNPVSGADVPAVERDSGSTVGRAASRAELATTGFLIFRVKTFGLPLLRPLSQVQLTVGAPGKIVTAFSGPCSVWELVHDWSESGWVTESKLAKSGGPIFNPGASEKPSEPVVSGGPSNTVKVKATGI